MGLRTGLDATVCTEQGHPGPWYQRLPHFKADHAPSAGEELQSEYFVARRYSERALLALAEIASVFHPFLLVSEIRTVAADELLLSRIPKASWGRPAALDFILHGA